MSLAFEKWEGLGNDFVVVESAPRDPAWVRAVCDRRRGVGGDGVLFVEGVRGGELRMTVLNADGSRPEMCGNGIRCAAGFVAAVRLSSNDLLFATDAGPKRCALTGRGDGELDVLVEMGIAKVLGERVFEVGGSPRRFTLADVGNPHAITFEAYPQAEIDALGPLLATATPAGQNVEFCAMKPGGVERRDGSAARSVDVTVWERGVGRTLACGTGACAVAAVACAEGRAAYGEPLTVTLPGGDLVITIERTTGRASMRGPARRTFRGVVDP